jgi:SAM-dependent methyltransferase
MVYRDNRRLVADTSPPAAAPRFSKEEAMTSSESPTTPIWDDERVSRWLAQIDQLERQLQPVSDALFAATDLRPGMRVLDVGCGTGPTTVQAATLVRPGGHVTGVDVSADVIAAAQQRHAGDRDPHTKPIEWLVANVDHHAFEPASFDAIISRFGVMFFADPVVAFGRLAKACRPGGQLVVAVWLDLHRSPFFGTPYDIAVDALVQTNAVYSPVPAAFGPSSLGDADLVRSILASVGWSEITTEEDFRILYPGGPGTPAQAVESVLNLGHVAQLVQSQPPEVMEAVRAAMTADFERRHDGTGVALPGGFMIVSAVRAEEPAAAD